MTLAVPLPTDAHVRDLLDGLVDKQVAVHEEALPVLRGRDVHVVGCYVEDGGSLRAAVLTDLALGACLGAALALVPVSRVQEALSTGAVPPDLADNTREVLNVAASLFNGAEAHLKLDRTWVAPESVADDVAAFLRGPLRRVDLSVSVTGYGSGVLALLMA